MGVISGQGMILIEEAGTGCSVEGRGWGWFLMSWGLDVIRLWNFLVFKYLSTLACLPVFARDW